MKKLNLNYLLFRVLHACAEIVATTEVLMF